MASSQACRPVIKVATVPEVTITENRDSVAGKNYVRPSWKALRMQPIAKAATPEFPAEREFTPGTLLNASSARCSARVFRSRS